MPDGNSRQKKSAIATREQRQAFWSDVMFGNVKQKVVVVVDGQDVEVEVPYSMRERLKASELLGRSEADFIDRHQHSGFVGVTSASDLSDEELDEIIKSGG